MLFILGKCVKRQLTISDPGLKRGLWRRARVRVEATESEGSSEIWVYVGNSSARRLRSSDSLFLVVAS